MSMATKQISVAMLWAIRNDDGSQAYVTFDELAKDPAKQGRVVQKRRFRKAVDRLKAHGCIEVIPYIGPEARR